MNFWKRKLRAGGCFYHFQRVANSNPLPRKIISVFFSAMNWRNSFFLIFLDGYKIGFLLVRMDHCGAGGPQHERHCHGHERNDAPISRGKGKDPVLFCDGWLDFFLDHDDHHHVFVIFWQTLEGLLNLADPLALKHEQDDQQLLRVEERGKGKRAFSDHLVFDRRFSADVGAALAGGKSINEEEPVLARRTTLFGRPPQEPVKEKEKKPTAALSDLRSQPVFGQGRFRTMRLAGAYVRELFLHIFALSVAVNKILDLSVSSLDWLLDLSFDWLIWSTNWLIECAFIRSIDWLIN